jgi:poly(3-hydroxybutyrate) depolymerase
VIAVLVVLTGSRSLDAAAPAVDAAFAKFWHAANPAEAEKAIAEIIKSGVSVTDAEAVLKRGRPYATDAPRGIVRLSHQIDGVEYAYTLDVPESYAPNRSYQVRIQLHGGVGRPDAAPRGNGIGALAGAEQIYILPTAWSDAEWWTDRQLANLRVILDRVKRTYNVDENRVVLSGVSDGGTGTYYVSMRETTPFAAFLPLNGAIAVLRSSNVRTDGEIFPNNVVNKPFFIVNGGRDPLYPTTLVEPYIQQMIKGGTTVKYLPQPEAVHNTAWWPEVKDIYEAFVREHPRNPHPEHLTWETDLSAGTNRAHWLVIDAVAKGKPEATAFSDVNDFVSGSEPNFGIRAAGMRVTAVTAGSNAASFGLLPGDIVAKINQRVIPQGVDLVDLMSIYDKGDLLTFVVTRDGQSLELKGTYNPVSTPKVTPMFTHVRPTGRVDATRSGNTVTATTRGVEKFTVLVSPDAFDLTRPLTVVANGKTVFNARVTSSLATLLKWAARDNDRTLLYAAEVPVTLAP